VIFLTEHFGAGELRPSDSATVLYAMVAGRHVELGLTQAMPSYFEQVVTRLRRAGRVVMQRHDELRQHTAAEGAGESSDGFYKRLAADQDTKAALKSVSVTKDAVAVVQNIIKVRQDWPAERRVGEAGSEGERRGMKRSRSTAAVSSTSSSLPPSASISGSNPPPPPPAPTNHSNGNTMADLAFQHVQTQIQQLRQEFQQLKESMARLTAEVKRLRDDEGPSEGGVDGDDNDDFRD